MIKDIVTFNDQVKTLDAIDSLHRNVIHHYGDIVLGKKLGEGTIKKEGREEEILPFVILSLHEVEPSVGVGNQAKKENVNKNPSVSLHFSNTTSIDIYIKALEKCKSILLLHKLS